MTVHLLKTFLKYTGLSSDIKPTKNIIPGSLFFETDTFRTYTYDGSNWRLYEEEKFFDLSDYLIRAQGTVESDGVQYSNEVSTIDANVDYELLLWKSENRYSRLKGNLGWIHYNIVFQLKAGSATADLIWKLQARNKGGIWTDMCAAQTEININTTYVNKRIKGYLDIKTNIETAPFEMKLIFQSNEATPGIGTGKVKNDTIIRMVGEVA